LIRQSEKKGEKITDAELPMLWIWTDAGHYIDPGMDYYEQQYQEQVLHNLRKKAQSLGFDLVAQSTATESVS